MISSLPEYETDGHIKHDLLMPKKEKKMNNDDWFDRHEKRMDAMFEKPGRTFLKFGVVALLLNLVFWGFIILMVVLGLKWVL